MRHPLRRAWPKAALVLAVLATAASCEDSDPTAPGDGTLTLQANPSTVRFDENLQQTEGSTTLIAQVFDAEGKSLSNIAVLFNTEAGRLASSGGGGQLVSTVKTDSRGIAQEVLTVSKDGLPEIRVKVSSAALTAEVTVKKGVVALNQQPTAVVVAAPLNKQAINENVTFDGTSSDDPDDDRITMYRWTIDSTNPDPERANPYVVEGAGDSGLVLGFANVQNLSVTLQVTDDPEAQRLKDDGLPIPYSPFADFLRYEILRCRENVGAPTAVIAGTDPLQAFGTPGQTATVPLDGSASSDPEWGPSLSEYRWSCGGPPPVIQGQPAVACGYSVQSECVDYKATLVVIDKGSTGEIDPVLGDYCDKKESELKIRVVRVCPRF